MVRSFVADCDMFISCLQNVCVILMNKFKQEFSSFYLKHGKQAVLSLILLVSFDVTNVTLPLWRISEVGRINRTTDRQ